MTTKTKTKTKAPLITKKQVVREISRIIKEKPQQVNPVNDKGNCLYHAGRGSSIKRCLVGQLAWDLGLPTPKAVDDGAFELARGLWFNKFTDSARDFITAAQYIADGAYRPDGDQEVHHLDRDPVAWGNLTLAGIERLSARVASGDI